MDGVSLETIEIGIELFNRELGHVNAHVREQQAGAKAVLEKANEDIAVEVVDVTDLEEAVHSELMKGWYSQVVVLGECDINVFHSFPMIISRVFHLCILE